MIYEQDLITKVNKFFQENQRKTIKQDEILKIINDQPKLNQWVLAVDRFPEQNQEVLCLWKLLSSDNYNNVDNEGHILIAIQNEGTNFLNLKKNDRFVQGIFMKYLTVDNEKNIKDRQSCSRCEHYAVYLHLEILYAYTHSE